MERRGDGVLERVEGAVDTTSEGGGEGEWDRDGIATRTSRERRGKKEMIERERSPKYTDGRK